MRCFYYNYNFDNLVISFEKGVTCNAANHFVDAGELIIICAQQNPGKQVYGFLARSQGIALRTAKYYWPDFHRPDNRVMKIEVLSRLVHIPSSVTGPMCRAGIMKENREEVKAWLLAHPNEIKRDLQPVITKANIPKPKKLGYIYILEIDAGYKIGITTNLDQRMKQLEVPSKASIIGHWQSRDYEALERLLHKTYKEWRVPQSEWFTINRDQLQFALDLLNSSAKCLTDKALQESIPKFEYTPPPPPKPIYYERKQTTTKKHDPVLVGALSFIGLMFIAIAMTSCGRPQQRTDAIDPDATHTMCVHSYDASKGDIAIYFDTAYAFIPKIQYISDVSIGTANEAINDLGMCETL
mgnify:CR=1 FL=1